MHAHILSGHLPVSKRCDFPAAVSVQVLVSEVSVYVVQIPKRCPTCKRHRKRGMRCCLYVGMTGKTPEERLADHFDPKPGQRRTIVTNCGGTLRRDLYDGLVFPTREEALDAEASLAANLADLGYTVFGPKVKPTRR